MYLSELFLDELGKNYKKESVMCALVKCDEEMKRRWKQEEPKKTFKEYFFEEEQLERPRNLFIELMDFWDAYKDFDDDLSEAEKEQFILLQTIYTVREKFVKDSE